MTTIIGASTTDDALSALRAFVSGAEERGEKTLIFCEDKLTLLAERAVLSACGGTFSTEVTTFARFLSGPKVLSKEGSVLEISALLYELAPKLRYFRPRAARAVYETVAQLSASRVDSEALRRSAECSEGAIGGKLSDLALLTDAYKAALAEKGLYDESGYLSLLPEKFSVGSMGEKNVLFFGFRSFTKQALEGVRAAILSAKKTVGIFLSGKAELYTREALTSFLRVSEELGGAEYYEMPDTLSGEARILRDGLFSPEKLLTEQPVPTRKIARFTGEDEAEEFSKVSALIKKHVFEGARYRDIAVLVGDKSSFSALEKAFNDFRIPFFADKKRAFSQHPFCLFLCDVLLAVSDGVLPDEADAIASSVYFGDGDEYRNYLLKFGGYRGSVRREIREEKGFDLKKLTACRERMLSVLALFPRKGKGKDYVAAVRALKELSDAENVTASLMERFTGAEREFLDLKPLDGILAEIGSVAGEKSFSAREFCDGLRNALSALEISMIPQFLDAVYVGEISESDPVRFPILFASGLTGEVPRVGQDTALITDREMAGLAALKVEIEPAIAQVNKRTRESTGLALCAFTEKLYLSRPLRKGKEDTEESEIFAYAEKLFRMPALPDPFPFDCSERQPALLRMFSLADDFAAGKEESTKEYSVLYDRLGGGERREKKPVKEAGKLAFSSPFSPTLLETYFECPYAGFARLLRLQERQERMVLAADAGTFLHAALEECAKKFNAVESEDEAKVLARETGEKLMRECFFALFETGQGRYTGSRLLAETETVVLAAYRQLKGSSFRVRETEQTVEMPDLLLAGKPDRVDESDSFVRVIDYKTGDFDSSAVGYYTGRSLQLELYLRAASRGGRAAGAFYFPAVDEFRKENAVPFRMDGFYCGDEDVIARMDNTFQGKGRSLFFNYYSSGQKEKAMTREDFEHFLDYGVLVSRRAEEEIGAGNISPSPYQGRCTYCKLRSLCGFTGTPRKETEMSCSEIVSVVRREKGEI